MSSATDVNTHGLSINIYGRGDATLGDGPSHMAIALYKRNSPLCEIHHIRNPDDQTFIYDPRTQPLDDPVLRGRCEIASFTSETRDSVTRCLSAFGADKSNIPELGTGNCQDWVAGAISAIEADVKGCFGDGEGEGWFWNGMIDLSADEMKERCISSGRVWVNGPERNFEGAPDAKFSDMRDSTRDVGRLAQNPAFKERMQALMGGGEQTEKDAGTERPFYISSPFFSQRHDA